MKLIFTYIIVALAIVSCTKDLPELPQENNPVFKAIGTIDGQEFSISAGLDGAYMYTNNYSSNGVETVQASLTGGANSFNFKMHDGNTDLINSNFILDNNDLIKFNKERPTPLCILSKDDLSNAAIIESVNWFNENELIGVNTAEINEPGVYKIRAEVNYMNGTTASLSNELIIGYRKNANASIKHIVNQSGVITCWLNNPLNNLDRVEWRVNGELISETKQLQIDSIYSNWTNIEATCFFLNDVRRIKTFKVNQNIPGMFIEDFTPFEELHNYYQDFKSELEIEFNGTTYSSIETNNDGNHIVVNDIDYHGQNENGENISKLSAESSFNLLNHSTGQIVSAQFSLELGIKIP